MTPQERKVMELALEALLKTQNEGFNLPGSAIREAITAIKEALAQPEQEQSGFFSREAMKAHSDGHMAQPEDKKCENCGEFGECCQDAQPEQEPVAVKHMMEWVDYLKRKSDYGQHLQISSEMSAGACWDLARELEQFINTTPPQRKPLTDEQIFEISNEFVLCMFPVETRTTDRELAFARAIEKAVTRQPQIRPLTDDVMWKLWNAEGNDEMNQQEAIAFARAIEAAHGIKE